jgi:hypothetical protein
VIFFTTRPFNDERAGRIPLLSSSSLLIFAIKPLQPSDEDEDFNYLFDYLRPRYSEFQSDFLRPQKNLFERDSCSNLF